MTKHDVKRYRRLALMLLGVVVLLALAVPAMAVEVEVDGITYVTNEDGTATLKSGRNVSGEIVIPKAIMDDQNVTYPVTTIADYAFSRNDNLTSVTIPGSVTSIGSRAFAYCQSLETVTIDASGDPLSIESYAFAYDGLKRITIPGRVKQIGIYFFAGCRSLETVVIEKGITEIPKRTFEQCSAMSSFTIPDSVETIGEGAFENCTSLEEVTIPDSVTSIEKHAFGKTGLKSVVIPGSVTTWGESAFVICTQLKRVTLQEGLTSIGEYAFSKCSSLEEVTIPNSVTSIGYAAFSETGLKNVTIPNSVTSIGNNAFNSCTGLKNVTIPNSVTSIGDYAFYGCGSLASVTIPDSVTIIRPSTFSGCSNLTEVTIPNSVTSIGYNAFAKTGLKNVTIPNSVKVIEDQSFAGCKSLTEVTIPDSVTDIGSQAFINCANLKDLYFDGTKEKWDAVTCGSNWNKGVHEDFTVHWRCTVTWKNGDTELDTDSVYTGVLPVYTGETPTKAADAQYTYTFAGWDQEIVKVTGDATYTATYDKTVNEYTVTFVNEDGTELQSGKVAYGDKPEYTGETPEKKSDAQYSYIFAGWEPEIAEVTGDATYTATFDKTVNEYTVTFVNYDGTELQSGKVAYGETPEYTGETPTRPASGKYRYTFSGWKPALAAVTEDATYTAKYQKEKLPAPKPSGRIMPRLDSVGKKSLKLTWSGMKNVDGYDVFFARCGSDDYELKASLSAKKTSYKIKNLEQGVSYKVYMRAWVKKNGAKKYVGRSLTVHCYTDGGSGKVTNPKAIRLQTKTLTTGVKAKAAIKATVTGQDGKLPVIDHNEGGGPLRYLSLNPAVATVNAKGVVKGVKAGTCKIYVIAENGLYKTVKVTVKAAPTSVKFGKKSYTVKAGKSKDLAKLLKLSPEDCFTTFTWESSNEKIAAVDKDGRLTALKKGKVTVTVTTANGLKATVKIVVKK